MFEVLKQTRFVAKLAIVMVLLGIVCAGVFLVLTLALGGVWGNPKAAFAEQIVMGLLSIISVQSAFYIWNRNVMPEIFLTMCKLTREMGTEDLFIEECRPINGDSFSRISQRAGLRGLLMAFNKAQPVLGKN